MFRVLFVCTGNICRSPTAEGVFRSLADAAGLSDRIMADSAGIGRWHVGDPPDPRSQQTARDRGIELSNQRARAVRPDDFELFDLILAMDSGHHRSLVDSAPGNAAHRIRMFMDYAPETGITDVPDPYYGDGDGFARVFEMIEQASKGLLAEIMPNLTRC